MTEKLRQVIFLQRLVGKVLLQNARPLSDFPEKGNFTSLKLVNL